MQSTRRRHRLDDGCDRPGLGAMCKPDERACRQDRSIPVPRKETGALLRRLDLALVRTGI
jgi:hypothetical protein